MAPSLGVIAGAGPAHAQSATAAPAWRHALSLFGDIKYPADFKRFDYVNPDAPKGGIARQILIGTFDNFNLAVAGVKGSIAAAVQLDLRIADDVIAGRGFDGIRRAGRVGQPSRGFLFRHLSAAGPGEMA